ncbi:MAG: IS1182 family transposase [Phycisphaerae bacterium]
MSGFRKPELRREQMVLWSQRLEDAIPADHPVRFFNQLLHAEPFAATFRAWERDYVLVEGQPPYHPRDLAGLYLYGMLNRLRSSRQLEAACWNRLDVIWLMQGQHPDHATIAGFVSRHGKRLRELFRDVLRVGLRAGLIKLEHVATDGTKVEADAGRDSVRGEKKIRAWLGHVDEKLAALEAEWTANENREATLFGDAACWAPPRHREPRAQLAALKRQQARLKRALAEIERRREESARSGGTCKAIASTTDPDSRCMKDKEGRRKPNYNAQLSVDAGAAGMIVACEVNDAPEDSGQLSPMLKQVQENCGRKPQTASADSGYNTGPELAFLEQEEISGYLPDAHESGAAAARSPADRAAAASQAALQAVRKGQALTQAQWAALPRDASKLLAKSAFVYDAPADAYRCPAGHALPLLATNRDRRGWGTAIRKRYGFTPYGRAARPRGDVPCTACPHAQACCRDAAKGRRIERDQYEEYRERMRARMNCAAGRAVYKRRRETVEPRIGWLKQGLGLRRFMRRGLEQAGTEWSLACTAVNISILLRCWEKVVAVL